MAGADVVRSGDGYVVIRVPASTARPCPRVRGRRCGLSAYAGSGSAEAGREFCTEDPTWVGNALVFPPARRRDAAALVTTLTGAARPPAKLLSAPPRVRRRGNKEPPFAWASKERMMGLEPTTFCMARVRGVRARSRLLG
jgi:hypothetical protein